MHHRSPSISPLADWAARFAVCRKRHPSRVPFSFAFHIVGIVSECNDAYREPQLRHSSGSMTPLCARFSLSDECLKMAESVSKCKKSIDWRPSPFDQRSQSSAFCAAVKPIRLYFLFIAISPSLLSKIKGCIDRLRSPPKADIIFFKAKAIFEETHESDYLAKIRITRCS